MSLLLARIATSHRHTIVADSYKNAVLADSPRCYWRLGETSGTIAADASGNGNAGAYTQDVSLMTAPGLLTGDANGAILIPVTPKGVLISTNPVDAAQAWTCEAIIKPTNTPPEAGVGALWQFGPAPGPLELDTQNRGGGTFGLRVMRTGVAQLFASAKSIPYNMRTHVALTYNGTTGKLTLYINGAADANSAAFTFTSSAASLRLGIASFSGSDHYPCQGTIDEAALYQSELSAARVFAHYSAM